jgi:hypothetical protein
LQSRATFSFIPTAEQGDIIVGRLTERYRHGKIWLDDEDAIMYWYTYLGSTLFFFFLYNFWKQFFKQTRFHRLTEEKTSDEQVFFIILWTSQAHHIFVAVFSTYLMLFSCQNEYGLPWPTTNGGSFNIGKNWGWWRDAQCMMEMNKGYVHNIMVSIGFMTVEFLLIHFCIENPTRLNK